MKKTAIVSIVVLAFILGMVVGRFLISPTAAEASYGDKWEYEVISSSQGQLKVNQLGRAGWEMVSAVGDSKDHKIYFKRRK